eukprot:5719344-Prymnesium_polylepis.1
MSTRGVSPAVATCRDAALWRCTRQSARLGCERVGVEDAPPSGGADELGMLSQQPSAALTLALLPPRAARNYLDSRSYLPSPRYWCRVSAAARESLRLQAHRRRMVRRALCRGGAADAAEMEGMLRSSVKGGVAKMLVYSSESAVRLALAGRRQRADAARSPWYFADGVAGCPTASWLCFFRESLCEGAGDSTGELMAAAASDGGEARRAPDPMRAAAAHRGFGDLFGTGAAAGLAAEAH